MWTTGNGGCVCLLFLFIIPLLTSIPSLFHLLPLFVSCPWHNLGCWLYFSDTNSWGGGSPWFLLNWTLFVEGQRFYLFFFKAQRLCKRSDLCWRNQLLHGYAPQMSLYPHNQWRRGNIKKRFTHRNDAQRSLSSPETLSLNTKVLLTWWYYR